MLQLSKYFILIWIIIKKWKSVSLFLLSSWENLSWVRYQRRKNDLRETLCAVTDIYFGVIGSHQYIVPEKDIAKIDNEKETNGLSTGANNRLLLFLFLMEIRISLQLL